MKVVVTGLRGFPDIQGGVETHCEELFPRLVALGCDVTVVRRKAFVHENPVRTEYKGVKFKDLSAPKVKGLEAAIHTMKAIVYAKSIHADFVHIQAIGPSVAIPLAKILGLKVVMTNHGPDYDREKWGKFAKMILRIGEYFSAKMANQIIVISTVIADIMKKKYNRTDVHLIYNGVNKCISPDSTEYINSLGLEKDRYILAVGRFVEEKGFDKLIKAFLKLNLPNYKLAIAGDADNETAFSLSLKELAHKNGVVLTGMIKGNKLAELYSNAALFALPSSHEGLPFTLLEAMSYSRKIVVSDIPANKVVNLPEQCYYHLNDENSLIEALRRQVEDLQPPIYNLQPYNWDYIAQQTLHVYRKI